MSDAPQSRFFVAPDGLNLHALLYGETEGDQNSAPTPIVCLPGLTRPARDFDALARFLRGQSPRRVVSIDYRGRGGSDWDPDWRHYCLPVESADILAILDKLQIASAIFIGWSRGGLHAMLLPGQRPELVKAMVLDDVGPALDPAGLSLIKNYIGRLPLLRTFDEAAAWFKQNLGHFFPAVSDEHWLIYAHNSLIETPERLRLGYDPQLARTLDAFDPQAPQHDLWPQFSALTTPILTLRGSTSNLLSEEVFAQMAQRNPLCQTHVVEGQGHAPLLLDKPTLGRIGEFVAQIDQSF